MRITRTLDRPEDACAACERALELVHSDAERELAHRAGDDIDVSLCWDQRTDRVTVKVYEARFDEALELEVDRQSVLDAYCHPFGYAAAQTRNRRLPTDALAA